MDPIAQDIDVLKHRSSSQSLAFRWPLEIQLVFERNKKTLLDPIPIAQVSRSVHNYYLESQGVSAGIRDCLRMSHLLAACFVARVLQ
jgi:hypothetical protein